jgi:hypothetical protein
MIAVVVVVPTARCNCLSSQALTATVPQQPKRIATAR